MKFEEIDSILAGPQMDGLIRRTVFQSQFVLLRSKQWGTYTIMWLHEWDKLSKPTQEMDDVIHWEDWKRQPISGFMGEGPFGGWSQDNELALMVMDEIGCGDVWKLETSSEGTTAELVERRMFIPDKPIIKSFVSASETTTHFALAICRAALKQYMLNKKLSEI